MAPIGAAFVSSPARERAHDGPDRRVGHAGAPVGDGSDRSRSRHAVGGAAGLRRRARRLAIEAVRMPLVREPASASTAPPSKPRSHGAPCRFGPRWRGLGVADRPRSRRSASGAWISARSSSTISASPMPSPGPLDLSGEAILRLPDVRPPETMRGVDGSGRIKIGPGKVVGREVVTLVRDVVGLGSAVSSVVNPGRSAGRSPLDFDSITATYTVASGVARTEDLVYTARDVRVTAAGTYGLGDRRVAMEVTADRGGEPDQGPDHGRAGVAARRADGRAGARPRRQEIPRSALPLRARAAQLARLHQSHEERVELVVLVVARLAEAGDGVRAEAAVHAQPLAQDRRSTARRDPRRRCR